MTYGIKISKPGFDVKTCENKDLIFSSEINTMKDFLRNTASKTFSTPTDTITVAHGQSFVPSFKVYYDNNDGKYREAANGNQSFVGDSYELANAYTDSTNLVINLTNTTAGSITFNVTYFLFKNKSIA